MIYETFPRLPAHGVAVLNIQSNRCLSSAFGFASFHDFATLASQPRLCIKLRSLLPVKSTTQHARAPHRAHAVSARNPGRRV